MGVSLNGFLQELQELQEPTVPWTNLPQGSAKYHPGLFLDALIKGGSSKEP